MKLHGTVASLCLVTAVCADHARAVESEPRYVAFSVREACRLTKDGAANPSLAAIGGITRMGAFVYDPAGKDLILIGLAVPGLPAARWDDFVVALRSRVLYHTDLSVSIDPAADTPQTRLQNVTFSKHLEDTPFGQDFLQCDILLKQYSLEQLEPVPGVPSYRRLVEDAIRAKARRERAKVLDVQWHVGDEGRQASQVYRGKSASGSNVYQARFWFKIREPYQAFCRPTTDRPEVFRIDEVALKIDSEDVLGTETKASRQCRQAFADNWTEHFAEACAKYPNLKKLKTLYDLTAVADAIWRLQEQERPPYMDHLLHGYKITPASTDRRYPVTEMYGIAKRSDRATDIICVSGGIDIEVRPEIKILNDGSVLGLRKLVIESRPSPTALTWQPPLAGWRMPNGCQLLETPVLGSPRRDESVSVGGTRTPQGCYLHAQSVTIRPSAGTLERGTHVFHGFSLPQLQTGEITRRLPTYRLNGVLINPNPVRDPRPLDAAVDKQILDGRGDPKKPQWKIELPKSEVDRD
jgi:hypothetical protein